MGGQVCEEVAFQGSEARVPSRCTQSAAEYDAGQGKQAPNYVSHMPPPPATFKSRPRLTSVVQEEHDNSCWSTDELKEKVLSSDVNVVSITRGPQASLGLSPSRIYSARACCLF